MGKRAVDYRREFKITPDMANGTAVNVCTMVFGNLGNDSGTGVAFTRNPGSGENKLYGEYLVNAQGEDVVAVSARPNRSIVLTRRCRRWRVSWPGCAIISSITRKYRTSSSLSRRARSTVCRRATENERGCHGAYVSRDGERGLISKEKALLRIQPTLLEQMLYPRLDPTAKAVPLAQGCRPHRALHQATRYLMQTGRRSAEKNG